MFIVFTTTVANCQIKFKVSYSNLAGIDIHGKDVGPFEIPYTFVFKSNQFKKYSNDGDIENYSIISGAEVKYSNGYRFQFFMALDGDGDEVKISLFDNEKIGMYVGYPQGNILHYFN